MPLGAAHTVLAFCVLKDDPNSAFPVSVLPELMNMELGSTNLTELTKSGLPVTPDHDTLDAAPAV